MNAPLLEIADGAAQILCDLCHVRTCEVAIGETR
jgi:hypothetical protein